MKECCANCKYLDHEMYYCDGIGDLENESCHEYVEKLNYVDEYCVECDGFESEMCRKCEMREEK